MVLSLILMHINCLQECHSLALHHLVFDRNHLVEVNWALSVKLAFVLLVAEPSSSCSERLLLVPRTQVKAERFKFILDFTVVSAWPWTCFYVPGYRVHDVSVDNRIKHVVWLVFIEWDVGAYLAKNHVFLFKGSCVVLVLLGWWALSMSWIFKRVNSYISK